MAVRVMETKTKIKVSLMVILVFFVGFGLISIFRSNAIPPVIIYIVGIIYFIIGWGLINWYLLRVKDSLVQTQREEQAKLAAAITDDIGLKRKIYLLKAVFLVLLLSVVVLSFFGFPLFYEYIFVILMVFYWL